MNLKSPKESSNKKSEHINQHSMTTLATGLHLLTDGLNMHCLRMASALTSAIQTIAPVVGGVTSRYGPR
ncbi:hypothetical protein E2C01_040681 [Portunus trituberculatus]|uniref:Uncharacterized protein n=1 Tax=Portunus trituberculatus TaxID=210409 RepID=A0A5B7FNV9_PORTR|nr:hypothetical protein [Portunus trituberculatus]